MNSEIFTVEKTEINGCIAPFTQPIERKAANLAKPRDGQRASLRAVPRFTVKVDGNVFRCAKIPTLHNFLSSIVVGAKCRVFRNAGWGATIDFDDINLKR